MDYEKILKEALDDKSIPFEVQSWIEEQFPELQESEDERIRKELLSAFQNSEDSLYLVLTPHKKESFITWLEKQGEKKSADKIEPFDEYEGLTDFERTLADICIGWIGQEHGWKQYIKDNADVLLKIAIKKFNSIQDAPFEQKPAWGEEDEQYLLVCKNALAKYQVSDKLDATIISRWLEDKLKSLTQNTWKPSDEQMEALEDSIEFLGCTKKVRERT